jgi:SpoVK/Ycf46/Vps4 family AAA+-type ATPase
MAGKDSKEITETYNARKSTPKIKDALNIGNILSMLDGICNYSGIIIVAITNNKDDLPNALCRDLRLTPVYFTYMRKEDVINLIENFFNIILDEEQCDKIPDRKLSPARCRLLCEKYENVLINEFIEKLIQ